MNQNSKVHKIKRNINKQTNDNRKYHEIHKHKTTEISQTLLITGDIHNKDRSDPKQKKTLRKSDEGIRKIKEKHKKQERKKYEVRLIKETWI